MTNPIINNIISKIKNVAYYRGRYVSQVLNKKNPYISCFPSTVSMFLSNFDIVLAPIKIMSDCNNHVDLWRGVGRWTRSRFRNKMFQVWQAELNLINFYLENKTAVMGYKIKLDKLKELIKISPVIVNTTPLYKGKKLGHIMLISGLYSDGFIVDDPFGDFRVNYVTGHNAKGNNLKVTFAEFEKIRGSMLIYAK